MIRLGRGAVALCQRDVSHSKSKVVRKYYKLGKILTRITFLRALQHQRSNEFEVGGTSVLLERERVKIRSIGNRCCGSACELFVVIYQTPINY